MFDMASYVIGEKSGVKEGEKHVTISGDGCTFSDPKGDGNIVITNKESEVNSNG